LNIAIVILNYNGEKLLRQFLPSVIEHSKNASVFVADNGSTDGSLKILESVFPQVHILKLDKNYGFCGGYNRALKQVEADYYVLLNSDVEVTPGWLEPLLRLLENDEQIAAVQPKILSYQQKEYFEYAGAGGGFIDALGYPFCRGRLFDALEKDEGQYNDQRELFWATGACMMIRARAYHELGGFDDSFFAHMEEIDLCWRIQRSGSKVFYCGASQVYHVGAGTLSRSNPQKTYLNFRNGLRLLYKNLSPAMLWLKLPLRILLDYAAALNFTFKGNRKDAGAIVRAHLNFIKTLPLTYQKRLELKSKYPFTTKNVYKGVIVWDYFIAKKKRITF
jgi:GT2 family glycosyltransferase